MKKLMKLLVAFFVMAILTTFLSQTVLASELDQDMITLAEKAITEDTNITEDTYILENDNDLTTDDINAEEPESDEEALEIVIEDSEDDEEAEEEIEKLVVTKPSYSEKDLRLLASLIYSEAGNQSYNGMLAVANVVINRMESDIYGHADTIKKVIYDKKWSVQFAVTVKSKKTGISPLDKALKYYDTGKFTGANPAAEKKAMQKAIKAAKAALQGENNLGNYLCFQNKRSASSIKRKYSDYKIIGDHIFYRTK